MHSDKTKILAYFFLTILFTSCIDSVNNQNEEVKNEKEAEVTLEISDSLRIVILKITVKDLGNVTAQQEYFSLFPKDFVSFKNIFGYHEEKDSLELGHLYESSHQYILAYFQDLTSIDQNLISKKAINIGVDGVWQADGVNIFQHGLMEDMKANGDSYFLILDKLSDSKTTSFWRFYFDSPHTERYQEDFKILYERYADKNERVVTLMKDSFDKLLSESDGHGH